MAFQGTRRERSFEPGLVGVVAGEERDVPVTFPADYGAANLAGKEAVFSCTVKAVKAPVAASVDDELAKRFGAEDLAGLRTQVADRLAQEYAGAARAVGKRALLDVLDAQLTARREGALVMQTWTV